MPGWNLYIFYRQQMGINVEVQSFENEPNGHWKTIAVRDENRQFIGVGYC